MESIMKNEKIRTLVYIALIAAIICVTAPWAIPNPISPSIPFTLAIFVIALFSLIFGAKVSVPATALYIVLGALGVPVFSGFAGGFAKLAGPTGGYIVGFIGLAFLAGLTAYPKFSAMWKKIPLLIAGLAVAYAFGTVWFMISTGTGLIPSLMLCVVPYIPFDLAKRALALGLSSLVKSRLGKRVKV